MPDLATSTTGLTTGGADGSSDDSSSDDEFADAMWFEPDSDAGAAAQPQIIELGPGPEPESAPAAPRPSSSTAFLGGKKAPPLDIGFAEGSAEPAVDRVSFSPSGIGFAAAEELEGHQREELSLKQQQLALELRRRYTSLRPLFRAVFCKFDFDGNGFIDGSVRVHGPALGGAPASLIS